MDGWMDGWMDRWMDGWVDCWLVSVTLTRGSKVAQDLVQPTEWKLK